MLSKEFNKWLEESKVTDNERAIWLAVRVLEVILTYLGEYGFTARGTIVPNQVHVVGVHPNAKLGTFALLTVFDGQAVIDYYANRYLYPLSDPNATPFGGPVDRH